MAAGDIYLTCKQVAKLLHLSCRTLERMRADGTGPCYMKAGPGLRARVLYMRGDIDDWLGQHRYLSTSEYDNQ